MQLNSDEHGKVERRWFVQHIAVPAEVAAVVVPAGAGEEQSCSENSLRLRTLHA